MPPAPGLLDSILAAPAFRTAPALSRLLRYLIEEDLAGRGDSLKESTIAIEVFGRTGAFDPRSDSIVRVQCGKLRARLSSYYAGEGRRDPWMVEIPKGHYRPQWRQRSSRAPWWIPAVACAVLAAVSIWIGSAGPAVPDAESRQLYAKARYHWAKRSASSLPKSASLFEEAIRRSPGYSEAHAGLASAYSALGGLGVIPEREAYPKAKNAAEHALALDNRLAEAHATLAYVYFHYEWDQQAAEREFRVALRLGPRDAITHHWYGECLSTLGRHEEAIAEARRAIELDPASAIINAGLGARFFYARRYESAAAQLRSTLDLESNFPLAQVWLGWTLTAQGRFDEALAAYQHAIDLNGRRPITLASMAHAYRLAGRNADAERIAGELELSPAPSSMAMVLRYSGAGDRDRAFGWMDKAIASRAAGVSFLAVHPLFDPLRADPRFETALRRVNRM